MLGAVAGEFALFVEAREDVDYQPDEEGEEREGRGRRFGEGEGRGGVDYRYSLCETVD